MRKPALILALAVLAFEIAGFCQTQSLGSAPAPSPTPDTRSELAAELVSVKRVYVDSFGDDDLSKSLQAMVVNALDASKRFIVTENKDRADAILKGRSVEKTSQEVHATGQGTQVATAAGGHSSQISPSGGSSHGGFAGKALGIEDSKLSTETVNSARLAVRLVSKDGDVLWSTTQESTGAKFKGASADVADKVIKQLLHDLDKPAPNKM
jgi:curli biogenesis system outer membrane secretion channel CsgG